MNAELSRIADCAATLLDRIPAAEIGRRLGHATSTITRRSGHAALGDPLNWPAREFLTLAMSDEILGQAILDCLNSSARPLPMRSVVSDLMADCGASAAFHAQVMDALSDGRISPSEAAALRQRILERQEIEATALRSLAAVAQGKPL
jgi:hypothetical protein